MRRSRRTTSSARCLAVAVSQAAGFSGNPEPDHCSSAATKASCASSSARFTLRTIRASTAISFADSSLQTASSVARTGSPTAYWKSASSNSGRISTSQVAPGCGFGQRLSHSTASCIDFTCQSQ